MSIIKCPECGKEISDKAESCPHCGLPSKYFKVIPSENQRNSDTANQVNHGIKQIRNGQVSEVSAEESLIIDMESSGFDPQQFRNALISFEHDYKLLFSPDQYINSQSTLQFNNIYEKYYAVLNNELICQYLRTNADTLHIDETTLNRFIIKMQNLKSDIEQHDNQFVNKKVSEYKDYFDHIMDNIDPNLKLDEEQRRAVVTDDNHCLLVAGAGAGKTTTMAAKVKYLVEKQGIAPQDIVVISYTNNAVNELKERINKRLKIPAKVTTFHSFAYDIVRKANILLPNKT